MSKKPPRKIVGTFCESEQAPLKAFDRRSLRWKRSGQAWLLIGCPAGHYQVRKGTCKVGTRAYRKLSPAKGERCPVGATRVRK